MAWVQNAKVAAHLQPLARARSVSLLHSAKVIEDEARAPWMLQGSRVCSLCWLCLC
jgi:hypothetical protein